MSPAGAVSGDVSGRDEAAPFIQFRGQTQEERVCLSEWEEEEEEAVGHFCADPPLFPLDALLQFSIRNYFILWKL